MNRTKQRIKKAHAWKVGLANVRSTFDVLVLATMSAGKSSFINAMIGRELLPSANEATTACLTSIEHCGSSPKFRGTCYSHTGTTVVSCNNTSIDHVRAWNSDSEVKYIRLSGAFLAKRISVPRLVLHDTPGPNNSQDSSHEETMMNAVRTVPFKILCYVLNASQLGTYDDRSLLVNLRKLLAPLPSHQLIFLLNKVDLLDQDSGEDVARYVSKTKCYLERLGFMQPIIVPIMANIALFAKKALYGESLTRVEKLKLRQAIENLSEDGVFSIQAASMPDSIRNRVIHELKNTEKITYSGLKYSRGNRALKLELLLAQSGIKIVESIFISTFKNICNHE